MVKNVYKVYVLQRISKPTGVWMQDFRLEYVICLAYTSRSDELYHIMGHYEDARLGVWET